MSEEKKVTFSKNAVIVFDVTEKAIVDLEQLWQAEAIPKDLSIKEDYNLVKDGVATIRKLRSAVEARRKELKKDALDYGKQVDLTAKGISERLIAIETPIKLAKTTYDEKVEIAKREKIRIEEERVDGIALRIANIRALVEANISSDAATINDVIYDLQKDCDVEEWAQEFADKATEAINASVEKLIELFEMKLSSENAAKAAKEVEDKRLADEEQARITREEDAEALAEENAAEKKKLDAERAAFQKEKDDHQAKVDAEEKKRLDGIAAEEKKKADKTAKEEEKKRLADIEKKRKADTKKAKKEVEKRTKEAVDSICVVLISEGVSSAVASSIIELIKADKVPHVTFE